jgi:hypothetical protein
MMPLRWCGKKPKDERSGGLVAIKPPGSRHDVSSPSPTVCGTVPAPRRQVGNREAPRTWRVISSCAMLESVCAFVSCALTALPLSTSATFSAAHVAACRTARWKNGCES